MIKICTEFCNFPWLKISWGLNTFKKVQRIFFTYVKTVLEHYISEAYVA